MKKYIVMDVETTGLDPESNFVTEFSAVVFDGVDTIGEEFTIETWDQKKNVNLEALMHNTFDVRDGQHYDVKRYIHREAWTKIAKFLVDSGRTHGQLIPVGFNVHFDIDFVKKELLAENYNLGELISHKHFDLTSIAMYLNEIGKIKLEKFNSSEIYKFFGIPDSKLHTSSECCHKAMQVFKKFKELLLT